MTITFGSDAFVNVDQGVIEGLRFLHLQVEQLQYCLVDNCTNILEAILGVKKRKLPTFALKQGVYCDGCACDVRFDSRFIKPC